MSKVKRTEYLQCTICYKEKLCERHYGQWMDNACYQLVLRIQKTDKVNSDTAIAHAVNRRQMNSSPSGRYESNIRPIGRKNWEE